MSGDFLLPVRRAMLIRAKQWAPLVDLIPAASMWPSKVSASRTFPFTRFGSMIASPFRASGLNASSNRISWQAFTKPLMEGDVEVVSAEDRILLIGSAIKDCFDGRTIKLESGESVQLSWITTSPQRDGAEADAMMTTVSFLVEVLAN